MLFIIPLKKHCIFVRKGEKEVRGEKLTILISVWSKTSCVTFSCRSINVYTNVYLIISHQVSLNIIQQVGCVALIIKP